MHPAGFRYAWDETAAALGRMKQEEDEPDPFDCYVLTYRNPLTGSPTLPTAAWEMTMPIPGFKGRDHRHNSSVIYYCFEGSGVLVVEGERFEWSKGDFIELPAWMAHLGGRELVIQAASALGASISPVALSAGRLVLRTCSMRPWQRSSGGAHSSFQQPLPAEALIHLDDETLGGQREGFRGPGAEAEFGIGQDVPVGPLHFESLVRPGTLSLALQVSGPLEQVVGPDAVEGGEALEDAGAGNPVPSLNQGEVGVGDARERCTSRRLTPRRSRLSSGPSSKSW